METVQVHLETQIIQENETDNFIFDEEGTLVEGPRGVMVRYKENGEIPVRVLIQDEIVKLTRGVMPNDYSKMTFIAGEKTKTEYVSQGRELEIEVLTKKIAITQTNVNATEIIVEYDLYTGLYLVGNYRFKLIFNK